MGGALLGLGLLAAAGWAYLAFFNHGFWRADQTLPKVAGKVSRWPFVVALVPARNEEGTIAAALASLANQDYPGSFKIVAVNDNSSDRTAAAARGVKGPIAVLEAEPLGEGWAGKLAALHQGATYAAKKLPKAEYIWFTDADVVHGPKVLRALVEAAELDRRALVSQMVMLQCENFWERALVPAFVFFFAMLYPFRAVNDPRARCAAAAGGSILIVRAVLEEIGGIPSLKGELIDDCALAKRVKWSGHRTWLGLGPMSRSIRAYAFADFWAMVTRSAFTELRHSYALLAAAVFGLGLVFLAPPALAVIGVLDLDAALLAAGLFSWAAMVVLYAPTLAIYRLNPLWGLALPLISALYIAMTVDSGLKHALCRGAVWKGRAYDFTKKR